MLEIKEEELDKILPSDGPSIDEVKRYLEKYNDEYIVIKCGGSVLVDQNLFEIFIKDITTNIFINWVDRSNIIILFSLLDPQKTL